MDQEKLSEHIDIWDMKSELTSSRRKTTLQAKGTLGAKSWERKAHGECEELKGSQCGWKIKGEKVTWDKAEETDGNP